MPDPTYGPNPIDVALRWYAITRPPLIPDPEWKAWQAVAEQGIGGLLDSSWSVRWRTKSVVTAFGVHLVALAEDLGFLQPDGWSEDRLRQAAIGIDGAVFTNRGVEPTKGLAAGLAQPGQTWEIGQGDALTYLVIFYGITDDEAQTYRSVMEYGRPRGVRMVFFWSNVSKALTFVLDTDVLDGPAVLASAL